MFKGGNINFIFVQTSDLENQICLPCHQQGFRFFQDWWAEVTHGVRKGGLFSEAMGPNISN